MRGPLSALLVLLWDLGWEPLAADSWVDPSGVEWQITLDACVDLKPFEKVVKKHEESRMWANAADHHNGKGLEQWMCDLDKHQATEQAAEEIWCRNGRPL